MNESWIQILSLFVANISVIIWMRTESRNDWRHCDTKLAAHQKETCDLIKAIQEEMKDFHIRLLMIEKEKVTK